MGFFNSLFNVVLRAKDVAERNASSYSSGYNYGSERASRMSNEELSSSINRAKNNGVSGWSQAGNTRAMIDEYNNRKNKQKGI